VVAGILIVGFVVTGGGRLLVLEPVMRRRRSTGPMRKEVADAGCYDGVDHARHPRLQILPVEDPLTGKLVRRPSSSVTFKRAPKASGKKATNLSLGFTADDDQD
jgi:hypothetical protein